MDKLITFPGKSERGIFTYIIDTEHSFLTKTASEYHPEIAAYINNAKRIEGKTQVLLTALGAGEYWGNNANGDYFSESSLAYPGPEYGYKTFMAHAKVYKHHVNKDPNAAYGDVKLSVYNPIFHRVELIIILDNKKAPDIVEKINSGLYPEWSMGAKVKYDVCSICGNKARTRPEYCEHLRYYMGRLDPKTGRMVYAINPEPVFFDISQVFIGADKVAKTLKKVASLGTYKKAEIKKEITVEEPPASVDSLEEDIQNLKKNDPDIPKEMLNDMASKNSLKDILSTLFAARIIPRPHEFQRIVLVSSGNGALADHWDREGLHFDPSMRGPYDGEVPISYESVNDNLLDRISSVIPSRSFSPPHIMKRITILVKNAHLKKWEKIASERDPTNMSTWDSTKQIATAALIASLYHKVMSEAAKKLPPGHIPEFVLKNPKLMASLGFAAMVAPIFFNRSLLPSTIGNRVQMNPDKTDYMERQPHVSNITKSANQAAVGALTTFGGPLATGMLSDYLQKKRMTDPEYQEGDIKGFIRKYKEPAQLLTAAAGLGLLAKRPIPTKLYNMAATGLKSLENIIPHVKMGEISDFALDTLVWPLAMGGPHLAHRLAGSVVDQAMFEGIKRLSTKKNKDKLN